MQQKAFQSVLTVGCPRCVYCGTYASDRDHYLPWVHYRLPYYLPSCKRCNNRLGDKVFPTLGERAAHILSRLHRDAERTHISEESLEGLTGHLREACREMAHRHQMVQDEAMWALEIALEFKTTDLATFHERPDEIRRLEDTIERLREDFPLDFA